MATIRRQFDREFPLIYSSAKDVALPLYYTVVLFNKKKTNRSLAFIVSNYQQFSH